jgi:multidrug transporter EmrE-like cation transporter
VRDLILSILAGALGQVCLKKGMSSVGGTSLLGMMERPLAVVLNPWIIAGFVLYFTSFALWLVVLSKIELSRAYPMVSLGYLVTFILGVAFFQEQFSLAKVAGLLVVMTGVAILAWT